MKFGHNLWRNQVPEWAPHYINYKALKKLIKATSLSLHTTGDTDLAGIFFSLDRNLEDVDNFYCKKLTEYTRQLRLLHERFGPLTQFPDGLDVDDHQDLVSALLEIRAQLRKLQWFGEVNRRGFVKILKKLDKKIPTVCAQKRYLTSKVFPTPFATNEQAECLMKKINEHMQVLGATKILDDAGSAASLGSARTAASKTLTSVLTPAIWEKVEKLLRADDAAGLNSLLAQTDLIKDPSTSKRIYLSLLQRSISMRSRHSVLSFLSALDSLDEDDMNGRNSLHRLVITIGRAKAQDYENKSVPAGMPVETPAAAARSRLEASQFITPAETPMVVPRNGCKSNSEKVRLLSRDDESVQFLEYFLDNLKPSQRLSIAAKDAYGRLPLHYAAEHGFVVICQVLLERMIFWNSLDAVPDAADSFWLDRDGHSPLHHAVFGGHPLTTQILLDTPIPGPEGRTISLLECGAADKANSLLVSAARSNFVKIVQLLLKAGMSPTEQDGQGESALHVAARHGRAAVATILCNHARDHSESIDIAENTFGWTPLFIAAVDGQLDVLNALIDAGADLTRFDLSGWTAKEHAALRGHEAVMERLAELTPLITSRSVEAPNSVYSKNKSGLDNRKSDIKKEGGREREKEKERPSSESVKTFGHRYLTDKSMVLVTLGSKNMHFKDSAIKLDEIPLSDAHATQLDTALSLVISATGATGEPAVFDLPVEESVNTEPVIFMTDDPANVRVMFDIVPTYAGSKDRIVGRGAAVLGAINPSIGDNRMSLQGDVSVPIMASSTMSVIGVANFNFLVITPFSHPNMNISEENTYWKKVENTMVIGHRGLGKNVAARSSLQLGENTIQSFIAAANLGASYVEFDVQLTKDHVPVIYHDFLVSETGIDAPVHTLTLEQFLNFNEGPTHRDRSPDHIEHSNEYRNGGAEALRPARPRAYSAGTRKNETSQQAAKESRMRHTRDYKMKGFKGNSRGVSIQAPFTTLEEMFKMVPQGTGFNIEMKYPMLQESVEQGMDSYAVELNSFVDTVLKMVYDMANGRHIIFSSFNPDICVLLSSKQPSIPVMFLTDAFKEKVWDVRASSLQEAIRFCCRWNLLGVVSAAEPLVTCPRLVKVVKESGLVCVTYGTPNNTPENVNLQVEEGIDAVIVDSVLAIRRGLTERGNARGANSEEGAVNSPEQVFEAVADEATEGRLAPDAVVGITEAVEAVGV